MENTVTNRKYLLQLIVTIAGCILFAVGIPSEGGIHNIATFWAYFITLFTIGLMIFYSIILKLGDWIVETEGVAGNESLIESTTKLKNHLDDKSRPKWYVTLNGGFSILEAGILIYFGWFFLGTIALGITLWWIVGAASANSKLTS